MPSNQVQSKHEIYMGQVITKRKLLHSKSIAIERSSINVANLDMYNLRECTLIC